MIIKYWPIVFCLLFVVSGCKRDHKRDDEHDINWRGVPEVFEPCSDEERAELVEKATTEYPFVMLETTDEIENPRFCKRIKAYIHAIDVLPPEIRREFERAKEKKKLKIYIANEDVREFDSNGPLDAGGYFDDFKNVIVIKANSGESTLWHEIGHFIDFKLIGTYWGGYYAISFSREFMDVYRQIKNGDSHFKENQREGFADTFEYYIAVKIDPLYLINNSSYKIYAPLYKFFDELFLDVEKKIKEFHRDDNQELMINVH